MKQSIFTLALVMLLGFATPLLADDYEGNWPQFPDWADKVFTDADDYGD